MAEKRVLSEIISYRMIMIMSSINSVFLKQPKETEDTNFWFKKNFFY